MHQCPTCGKQLDENIRFCPDDGTPLTDTAAAAAGRTPTGGKRPVSKHIDLPAVVGQRYRLLEFRGGGGMAKVYRGVDLTLEREVAVKLINPELRTESEFDVRFQREARIASQLADPHIVVVHDFGIDTEHGPFLVMEYLKGQSLRERIQTDGPLPLKAVLQLAGQLLLALIHAHEKGIIHRDIKPDNVFLLSQSGVRLHVRVLDFGIARIYRRDASGSNETLTQPGAVLGTPRYMSPEQLAGQPIDVRSDLYSTAMVIHEGLTGQLPYVGGKKLCELCPEAPQALQDLLDHCLKPNPAERPQSALEVYMRLNELGKASGVLLLPPGALEKLLAARHSSEPTVEYVPKDTATAPSRRRWLIIGAIVAGVIAVALASWGLWTWLKKTPPPPAQESLLGVKVGDSRDRMLEALGERYQRMVLSSQDLAAMPKKMAVEEESGSVLRLKELLGTDAATASEVEFLTYGEKQVFVILLDDVVKAVVVYGRNRAAESTRGIRVEDSEAKLIHAYALEVPEVFSLNDPPPSTARPPGSKGYRYNKLGIGFEVENEKVKSITLYPPKAP